MNLILIPYFSSTARYYICYGADSRCLSSSSLTDHQSRKNFSNSIPNRHRKVDKNAIPVLL